MPQFYTKNQINDIATVIGTEVKELRSEVVAASDTMSFIEALNQAISSDPSVEGPFVYVENDWVTLDSPSENANTNFSFTINGGLEQNIMYDRIQDYWEIYKDDAPYPDYGLNINQTIAGLRFENTSNDVMLIELRYDPNGPTSDFRFNEGSGESILIDGYQIIAFKLAPQALA